MNSEAICLKLASQHYGQELFQELLMNYDKTEFEFVKSVWEPSDSSTSISESSGGCCYAKKVRIGDYVNRFLDSQITKQVQLRLREFQ